MKDLKKIIVWEHGHAYQPRRVIDGIADSPREVLGGLHLSIVGREVVGRNWFELMLCPGSVYDLVFEAMYRRSIDVDPTTLQYLEKSNPKAFERLVDKADTGSTFVVSSGYSHVILPLLVDESLFDAKVNLSWGICFYQRFFPIRKNRILFWLSECAYSERVARTVQEVLEEVLGREVKAVFLLDEKQSEGIDSSQVYRIIIDDRCAYAIFRCQWLSDAYAFSSNVEWIVDSLRRDNESHDPKILGTMIDAETYGGAYDPNKPIFFSNLRTILSNGIDMKNGRAYFDFVTVDKIASEDTSREARIADYTSWSDYQEGQVFSLNNMRPDSVVIKKTGGLCRWTGYSRDEEGREMKTAYFTIFEWIHPSTKQRYTRVLSSLWKIAFNRVRREGADIVREIVFSLLERVIGKERIEEIIYAYGSVIFEEESSGKFIDRFLPDASLTEKETVELALEAYKHANQDAIMSCPTFWQNFDTEVTWTSLSFTAAGMILVARACSEIGDRDALLRIARKYQQLFLDFEESFKSLVDEYDLLLEQLYMKLREISKNQGFDVEREISKIEDDLKQSEEIAEKLYDMVFSKISSNPLWKFDVNKFLLLSKVLDNIGKKEDAKQAFNEAKLHEWRKCIGSAISEYSIPARVGVYHAKYFPDHERLLRLPTGEVETRTEIIIGEAHAYIW